MLDSLPTLIRTPLLAIVGALVGALVNWAIYRWAYTRKHNVSPWQSPDPAALPRKSLDRVPIVGWWGLKRDSQLHGKGFWIRPMLIELTWAIGLPLFYAWHSAGGLTDGIAAPAYQVETWFWGHTVLIALLCAATFIDFDEKMIPDGVTVVGFVFALLMAALAPPFRLPEVFNPGIGFVPVIQPIHFNSPQPLISFHHGWPGLAIAMALMTGWLLAMVPKLNPMGQPFTYLGKSRPGGWGNSIAYTIASVLRPPRQTHVEIKKRGPKKLTKVLFSVWLFSVVLIPVCWFLLPPVNWDSLFGAVVGIAFGGGIVWAVRIVAGLALGQEAMGFGDVILMSMIGAFLGWQSTLLVFALAPFAALAIVTTSFLISGNNRLPFGPYLSLAAVLVILFWPSVWRWSSNSVFVYGLPTLAGVLAGAIIVMGPMLTAVRWMREKIFGPLQDK